MQPARGSRRGGGDRGGSDRRVGCRGTRPPCGYGRVRAQAYGQCRPGIGRRAVRLGPNRERHGARLRVPRDRCPPADGPALPRSKWPSRMSAVEFWSSVEYGTFQRGLVRALGESGWEAEHRFEVRQADYWKARSRAERLLLRMRTYLVYPIQ